MRCRVGRRLDDMPVWAVMVAALLLTTWSLLAFAHHDFTCHQTSRVHCTACLIGSSDDRPAQSLSSAASPLVYLSCLVRDGDSSVSAVLAGVPSGRAPPLG